MTIIHDPFFNGSSGELFRREDAEEQAPRKEEEKREIVMVEVGFFGPQNNAFGNSFRNYQQESLRRIMVEEFYRKNHTLQTYDFAMAKKEEHGRLNKAVMSVWECCELLNEYVDESDPDLDEPQIQHLLQTAEAIRRDYPDQDWLHLTALIHDLGKVLLHPAFGGEPQWCVVGDTFPLGCAFSDAIVHHKFFIGNPDSRNPDYNTKLGIYIDNCGLENVTMSWGHDEYMYLVAKGNNTTLPPAALFIIRYHSFYVFSGEAEVVIIKGADDHDQDEAKKF
ncbi:UNVERIFIED_CONTAM: Inositol oxygenase 1 [Sesamum radiatum]|uniref:Inositol oxygenase n=1 Tax=Sesamum radiatum TaxID=300843 RepID=A0AAW2KPD0_SESRA